MTTSTETEWVARELEYNEAMDFVNEVGVVVESTDEQGILTYELNGGGRVRITSRSLDFTEMVELAGRIGIEHESPGNGGRIRLTLKDGSLLFIDSGCEAGEYNDAESASVSLVCPDDVVLLTQPPASYETLRADAEQRERDKEAFQKMVAAGVAWYRRMDWQNNIKDEILSCPGANSKLYDAVVEELSSLHGRSMRAFCRAAEESEAAGGHKHETGPKRLICACCGKAAIGRQWCNCETGYGLCARCVRYELGSLCEGELQQSYGIRGKHFATELTAECKPGMLVWWRTRNGAWHVGTFKELDNDTAIVANFETGTEQTVVLL